MIRFLEKEDIPDVLTIYQLGIDTGIATFETMAPSVDEWDKKFHPKLRYVFEENKNILGWVSVTPVSSREVYKGVGEVSIYIHPHAKGKGGGTQLLQHLIEQAKLLDYWMLQASIFEVNTASIQLHKKVGFHVVGVRKGIARKNDQWMNTVLMDQHLILD
ncbi:N-acetyltransferase family protein [Lysinibacillus endophyticus]|uniref:GNAT family N-acetyltransferase n=1 Tax=Ureibacillus endophyticus TaxID=1978490 RepID=UPI00313683B9